MSQWELSEDLATDNGNDSKVIFMVTITYNVWAWIESKEEKLSVFRYFIDCMMQKPHSSLVKSVTMSLPVTPYELLRCIHKLNEEKYSTWRNRTTFTLRREKVWSIVDSLSTMYWHTFAHREQSSQLLIHLDVQDTNILERDCLRSNYGSCCSCSQCAHGGSLSRQPLGGSPRGPP
jgi:hypothetical protein